MANGVEFIDSNTIKIDDQTIGNNSFQGTGWTSILEKWNQSYDYNVHFMIQFTRCWNDSSDGAMHIEGYVYVNGGYKPGSSLTGQHQGNGLRIMPYWVDVDAGIYYNSEPQYGIFDCDNDPQGWAPFVFHIPRKNENFNIKLGFQYRGVFMNGDGVTWTPPDGSSYGWYPIFNKYPSGEGNDYNDNVVVPPWNGDILYGDVMCLDISTGSDVITVRSNYDKPDRPVITGSTLDTGTKFTANIDWKYTTSAPVYLATVYYYDEITNSTVAGWPSTSDSTEAGAGGTTAFAYRKAPATPLRSEANGTMTYPSTGSWSFDQTRTARNPVGVVANAQAKSDGLYQDSNGWFTFFPAPVAPSGLSIAANGTYGATFKWTNNYTLSCYATEIWSASSMSVSNGKLVKSADAVLLGTVGQGVSTFSKTDIWSTTEGASTKTFYIAQKSSYDQWTNADKANFVKSGKLDGVYTSLLTGTLSNGGATIYWYDANGARHLGTPYWYDANGTRHDVLGVYWYDSNGTRHDIIA